MLVILSVRERLFCGSYSTNNLVKAILIFIATQCKVNFSSIGDSKIKIMNLQFKGNYSEDRILNSANFKIHSISN